jgi:hypothetical protein
VQGRSSPDVQHNNLPIRQKKKREKYFMKGAHRVCELLRDGRGAVFFCSSVCFFPLQKRGEREDGLV